MGLLGTLGLAPLALADPPTCGTDIHEDFACRWNTWVRREGARQTGGVDAQAIALWLEVKRSWKKVEKQIDKEYGI